MPNQANRIQKKLDENLQTRQTLNKRPNTAWF